MKQSRVDTSAQEDIANLVHRMRYDWDSRAIDDARFFVAFGQRGQKDEDFDATAAEVVARIRRDLPWLAQQTVRSRRILEIGCGVGRLMRHLAADCGEIHGVDISDEMIRLGRAMADWNPDAHLHLVMENDLRAFADASFDVVYSYAVMQHLPDRVLFWRYIRKRSEY